MYRILIKHHPRSGQEDAFIQQWQSGSDVIQTYAGALGTKLFRNPDQPAIFYAMADWESKDARNAAMKAIEKDRPDAETILHGYAAFLDQHEKIGEFELVAKSNPPLV